MWNFLPSCLRRHRRKIFMLGGVIGGVALLNSYLKRKFLEWETQRAAELCEQFKRSSHFEGSMSLCDSALISFAPKIKEIVCSTVDVNPVVDQLKHNPPNKMELWEQLKILVFTQAIGEMYAQCLLAVLLKVQMSILGGYVFANSNAFSEGMSDVSEQQKKYMSRIADFLANGINSLLVPIRKAVEEILKPIPLNQSLKLRDIGDIIASIRDVISPDGKCALPNVSCYLMDSNNSNGSPNDEFLEKIVSETKDILECRDFHQVLCISIDRGINSLMDKLSECFGYLSNGNNEFENPHDFQAPFAKIIPMMHNLFSQHQPTEPGALVHLLLQQESLNTFSANIYESFSQTNI